MLAVAALVLSLATGTIRGTVVEARTGQPLAAVLVRVQETGQQAVSDSEGKLRDYRRARGIAQPARVRGRLRPDAT